MEGMMMESNRGNGWRDALVDHTFRLERLVAQSPLMFFSFSLLSMLSATLSFPSICLTIINQSINQSINQ